MIEIKTISVTDQFGLNSLVIDFTIADTSEDISGYNFSLYKSNHQTQPYYFVKGNITDFTYRDFAVNLYDISINYYYKVRITEIATGETKLSDVYGEYKSAVADVHALGIVEIHQTYLENIITNKMTLLKKKRTGQVCTCFDTIRRRSNPVNCEICYGTRYTGGYYSPYEIYANFLNPPTKIEYFAQNDVGEWEGTPLQLWTQNYPLIQVQDIIIDKNSNIRYIVTNCHPSYMNRYLIRQTFQMQRLPDSNVVYQFAINPPVVEAPETDLTAFVSTWDTRNGDNNLIIDLPLAQGYEYNCEINWGDNTTSILSNYNDTNKYHTYAAPGIYKITIKGKFGCLNFNMGATERNKLISIDNWGSYYKIGLPGDNTDYYYFLYCENLERIPVDSQPNFDDCLSVSYIFDHCTKLNCSINWTFNPLLDVNFTYAFRECSSLNSDIKITAVSSTVFTGAFADNISLNSLITIDATPINTDYMFSGCTNLNTKPLITSKLNSISNCEYMFYECAIFNKDISDYPWDFETDYFNAQEMLIGATSFSSTNYDLLLNTWSDNAAYTGYALFSCESYYTLSSEASRYNLIDNFYWTIVDLGLEI
jgi:hypothetical protein